MSSLRDEGGSVRALRKSGLALVRKDVQKESGSAAAAPGGDAPSGLFVPHCCFYCAWCGEPILLPNDRIGSPFGFPDARKIDVRCIATVCLACRHIANYSMFRDCRGFDSRHTVVHAQLAGETVLVNWLHCVELSCMERVPFFVQLDRNNPAGSSRWLWDELTCASGHRIKRIELDPTLPLPLRTQSVAKKAPGSSRPAGRNVKMPVPSQRKV